MPKHEGLDKGPKCCIRQKLCHDVCWVLFAINVTELDESSSNSRADSMVRKSLVMLIQGRVRDG